MTKQDQQVSIAEICGWTWWRCDNLRTITFRLEPIASGEYDWKQISRPANWESIALRCPKYPDDLNAMREAIESQPLEIRKGLRSEVWRLSSQMEVLPPASVFAEAFLRVLKIWRD